MPEEELVRSFHFMHGRRYWLVRYRDPACEFIRLLGEEIAFDYLMTLPEGRGR